MRNTNNATATSYDNVDRLDRNAVDAGIVNARHHHSLRTPLITRGALAPSATYLLARNKPGYLLPTQGSFAAERMCSEQRTLCFASGSQRSWLSRSLWRPEVSADSRSIS